MTGEGINARAGLGASESRRAASVPGRVDDREWHPMERFFEPLRRQREERYARRAQARRGTKRRAVLTLVQNEAVFFPIWLEYYSRFFDAEDIYVLDHSSTDGSTSGNGFVRIPVDHDLFDNTWMVSTMEAHQHELLERYDVVLTADVDEIVAPLPQWGSLGAYIDRFDEGFVNCFGYEILHVKDEEGPFEPGRPVLEQRSYWFANDAYDKPVLSSEPMRWQPGFHARADGRFNFDPDLRLIHLHRMDYEVCRARHRRWRDRTWNERDLAAGWGYHNRISDDEEFDRWFHQDSCFEDRGIHIELQRIPDAWRGLF